jgi:hypothetical protein
MNSAVHMLEPLLVIDKVLIATGYNGGYVVFIGDLDICNDGSGPSHGDPHYQSQTAYYNGGKYLNADKDPYIVTPPQIIQMVTPVVKGCLGRVTNLRTGKFKVGVVGDVGPDDKVGEAAYCLAKEINPKITHNTGDSNRDYSYEFWPGIPAPGYKLQPS